jgi:hypothetical protein
VVFGTTNDEVMTLVAGNPFICPSMNLGDAMTRMTMSLRRIFVSRPMGWKILKLIQGAHLKRMDMRKRIAEIVMMMRKATNHSWNLTDFQIQGYPTPTTLKLATWMVQHKEPAEFGEELRPS